MLGKIFSFNNNKLAKEKAAKEKAAKEKAAKEKAAKEKAAKEKAAKEKAAKEKAAKEKAAKEKAAKEKAAKELKAVKNYANLLLNNKANSEAVLNIESNYSIINRLCNLFSKEEDKEHNRFAFIVMGVGRFQSCNLFPSITPYVKQGFPVVFITNSRSAIEENIALKIDELKVYSNVTIINTKNDISDVKRLLLAEKLINADYVTLLTLHDVINPRSFTVLLEKVITDNQEKKAFILGKDIDFSTNKNWSIDKFSCCTFRSDFLTQALKNCSESIKTWIPCEILKQLKKDEVQIILLSIWLTSIKF